jgi:hypothetical protein
VPKPRARDRKPSDLGELHTKLHRRRSKADRLWRAYRSSSEEDSAASAKAHQVWSNTIDEALTIAEEISRHQASSLNELHIKFEAIWWWIVEDDSVLDGAARRWLGRFRRSLHHLATESR